MVQLNRPYIGILGRTNVGKSSLVNAICRQQTSLVSAIAGTTTDPVRKNIELLGLGPVTLIDTAGWKDDTDLGAQRMAKTREVLDQINLAILVFAEEFGTPEQELAALLKTHHIPYFMVHNKSDILPPAAKEIDGVEVVEFASNQANPNLVIEAIISHMPSNAYGQEDIFGGFVAAGDEVVLVMPIDASAPAGRLILPQVQTMRALLDLHATGICLQVQELAGWLQKHTPKLVVTDSQAFKEVSQLVPAQIALTSFSILLSRLKGNFDYFLTSTAAIEALQEGDKVLILESCTHSVNKCDDIGRVKIPALLQKKTGKKLQFEVVASLDPLPTDLSAYKLAVQCGGCMVTRQQILRRVAHLQQAGVPVSNYGMTIAWCNGIFPRVTEIFRQVA